MKILLIIIFLFIINCSAKKVSKNHGFTSLEKKYTKIELNITNKNDLITLIGPPSSKSSFDENKWYYVERLKQNQSIIKLGNEKIQKNNILIVELNKNGIIKNKRLIKIEDMNDVKYVESITKKDFEQDTFIYDLFTGFREKINAPSRNRSKK